MMFSDIERCLLELFQSSAERFDEDGTTALLERPLVCVADALDPWFVRFKHIIGSFHWTPPEALTLKNPAAEARSVVCWCVPVAEAARAAMRAESLVPSLNWSRARSRGHKVLGRMEQGLIDYLEARGFASVAPGGLPENLAETRPEVGMAACWSLRHVAFVSGLGTFGLSGGLITRRGVAHRLAAVVTEAAIDPTPREYGDNAFGWCLRCTQGTCGRCIERCPAGSVGRSVDERDKTVCAEHGSRIRRGAGSLYEGEDRYGCGLCQTAVPCESGVPTALLQTSRALDKR